MLAEGGQIAAVVLIVAGAVLFLLRTARRSLGGGCCGPRGCGAAMNKPAPADAGPAKPPQQQWIDADQLRRRADRLRKPGSSPASSSSPPAERP